MGADLSISTKLHGMGTGGPKPAPTGAADRPRSRGVFELSITGRCTNGSDISLLYHAPKLEPTVHFASAPQTAPKQQNSPSNVPLNVTDLANADATTLTPVCFGHHGATQSVPMLVGELSVTFLVTPHTLFGGLASNARPMGVG